MISGGVIQAIVPICGSEDEDVRRHCVGVLYNLSTHVSAPRPNPAAASMFHFFSNFMSICFSFGCCPAACSMLTLHGCSPALNPSWGKVAL